MQQTAQLPGSRPARDSWELRNVHFAGLLAKAKGGDVQAFESLYDQSSRWLLSVVRRLVRDEQAEDVLAETYIQIWKTLHDYDESRGPPAVWMAVIARSRALDHLRREDAKGAASDGGIALAQEASHEDTPEQLLTRAQEAQLVRLSVARLDPKERLVVALAYFRDCSCPEISRLTGLSMATVKSSMTRAQNKLRIQFTRSAGVRPDPDAWRT